jgi:hypothetical protein
VLLPWLGRVRLPVDPEPARRHRLGSRSSDRRAKPVLTTCRNGGPPTPALPPGSQSTTDWAKPRIVQST